MPSKDADPGDLRLYTRRHLYSALRLTVTVVDKASGKHHDNTATGFILRQRPSDGRCFLVSNRHVFDPPYNPDSKYATRFVERIVVRGVAVSGRGIRDRPFEFELEAPAPHFPSDYALDVGFVDLGSFDPPREALSVAFSTSDLVHEHEVVRDEIGVGSEIVMAGYPELEQRVGQRPILVPGLVSSDLRYDAEYGGNTYAGRGLCHAFSRGGMSGAPVLTTVVTTDSWTDTGPVRRVRLLGVNAGHPREKHGPETMSLFVPAQALDDLLHELGDEMAGLRKRLSRAAKRLERGDDDDDRVPLVADDAELDDDEDSGPA